MNTTKTVRETMSLNSASMWVVMAILLTTGCAQKLGEIDRVQLDGIRKMDLEGEWYFKQTVTDTAYASIHTFPGDQSKLERGTFEIAEGSVQFFRTYEFTRNSQAIGLKNDSDTPYLRWLEEDEAVYTPNPYQARNFKYAEGEVLKGTDGAAKVTCAGGKGGMHDFCKTATANSTALCGHEKDSVVADRTAGNAVCVVPTLFIFRGAPLAAWTVDSHFDVQFTYNPGTGEKTNVKVENTSDRFWYEREYIRVSWGTNQVKNYQFTMSYLMEDTLASVFEGDAAPDGEGLRTFRAEDGSVEYWDYVTRYIVLPPMTFYEPWNSEVPACVFYPWYVGGFFECTSEEIRTRTAFLRVDPTDTYQVRKYSDFELEKFGFFRQERLDYDENFDTTYSGAIRNIQRWDLWDNHATKSDGTPDYSKMTPKSVVYYLSPDFPREYIGEAMAMLAEWSRPFDEVVEFLKPGSVPKWGMVVLCENNNDEAQKAIDAGLPVAETDSEVCRDMDLVKLNGDLRYSFLYSVNQALQGSPLGYGPSSADPLTGKVISASAYLFTGYLRLYANYAADLLEAATGYKDYVSTVEGLAQAQSVFADQIAINHNPPPRNTDEARERARKLVREDVRARLTQVGLQPSQADWAGMRMDMIKTNPELERALIFPAFRSLRRDLGALLGGPLMDSDVERLSLRSWANYRGEQQDRARLLNDWRNNVDREGFADGAIMGIVQEWKERYDQEICSAVATAMAAGEEMAFDLQQFNIAKDGCTAEQAGQRRQPDYAPSLPTWQEYNPATPHAGDLCQLVEQGDVAGYYWVNACTVAKLGAQISKKLNYTEQGDQLGYWKPSPWYTDTTDPLVGKTQDFVKAQGERLRGQFVDEVTRKMLYALGIHELGHTMGLRHNFEASTDAMNFPREYWDYKMVQGNDGSWQALDPFTPETDYQLKNRIREFQYSSVMDYGAKFNDLWLGLGHYDFAAIKYGYGGIVEVFANAPDLGEFEKYLADPRFEDQPDSMPPVADSINWMETLFKRVHYTRIPTIFGGPDKIYQRTNVLASDIIKGRCQTDGDCDAGFRCMKQMGYKSCVSTSKVEVPYRFCGDEYAGRAPYCDVWDSGVDFYEIVRNTTEDYWWYWPFMGRWRGRVTFSDERYASSVMRSFNIMKRNYQWWATEYLRFNQNDWWEKKFDIRWEEDINGGLAGTMGAHEAFNTLINVFAIPSGGYPDTRRYGYNAKRNRYETWTAFNDRDLQNQFILEENYGKFAARPMYPAYYLGGDEAFPIAGGAIYDRLNAFIALCDPTTDFLAIEEYPDTQRYQISFFNFFPDRMLYLLGGLTTHREANYAACVVENPVTKRPQYLRLRTPELLDDPNFCADGKYLEPEEVDYDFPTTWFRIPMLAAYYGMSLMINAYDRRYMDTTRIFLKGHEDAIDLPEDAETVEFTDKLSGKTYVAYKQGMNDQFDTGYYLVSWAKTVFDQYKTVAALQDAYQAGGEVNKVLGLLELLRGLHKTYDYTSIPGVVVAPEN
jgi:hypothetical protein